MRCENCKDYLCSERKTAGECTLYNLSNIGIPFGAFGSELGGFEYTIPQGYEAEIKDGKVIVKKVEGEDERIREWLIRLISTCGYRELESDPMPCCRTKVLEWLKKQKHIEKNREEIICEGVVRDGHYIDFDSSGTSFLIPTNNHNFKNGDKVVVKIFKSHIQEQKPADKVEPKFKVGDWILHKNLVDKPSCITEVKESYYLTSLCSFIEFGQEDNFRNWTIQDAKDGDVLATTTFDEWCKIVIFLSLNNDGVEGYGITLKNGILWFSDCGTPQYSKTWTKCLKPATKEQRDLLFSKMKEAGYEWDAEKKELKKIEQKPAEDVDLPEFESYLCLMFQKFRAKGMCTNGEIIDYVKEHSQKLRDILVNPTWSEEDEKKLLCICAWIKDYPRIADFKDEMYSVANNYVDWLKSLKDRVQPKQEWSDGDEEHIKSILQRLEGMCQKGATFTRTRFAVSEDKAWLKSLRPQKQWKPSEEQMNAMQKALVDLCGKDEHNIITGLYYDLKKLMEE